MLVPTLPETLKEGGCSLSQVIRSLELGRLLGHSWNLGQPWLRAGGESLVAFHEE